MTILAAACPKAATLSLQAVCNIAHDDTTIVEDAVVELNFTAADDERIELILPGKSRFFLPRVELMESLSSPVQISNFLNGEPSADRKKLELHIRADYFGYWIVIDLQDVADFIAEANALTDDNFDPDLYYGN
jgi:hypothetical protein